MKTRATTATTTTMAATATRAKRAFAFAFARPLSYFAFAKPLSFAFARPLSFAFARPLSYIVASNISPGVTIVDKDPVKAQTLTESLDVQAIVGDGTRAGVLNQAGTSKADLVVVVTDQDKVNMLASHISKQLGATRVILRLHDMRPLDGYEFFYKQALGFDVVLSTEVLAANFIVEMVRQHHALEVESFAEGRVYLRRFPLREESELTAEPLQDLRLPSGGGVLQVPLLLLDHRAASQGAEPFRGCSCPPSKTRGHR